MSLRAWCFFSLVKARAPQLTSLPFSLGLPGSSSPVVLGSSVDSSAFCPLYLQSCLLLSRVRLCVTLWTAARQAPFSLGILQARILEWVAMPSSRDLPDPGIELGSPALQADSYLLLFTLQVTSDPMDCSTPGSSVHGILQAQILEWVAVPFSRGPRKILPISILPPVSIL